MGEICTMTFVTVGLVYVVTLHGQGLGMRR